MHFDGALIQEQGVKFAVVAVKPHIVQDRSQAEDAIRAFQPFFPRVPVTLVGVDTFGEATWFGRPDIVRFMSRVSPTRIPWRRYTVQ